MGIGVTGVKGEVGKAIEDPVDERPDLEPGQMHTPAHVGSMGKGKVGDRRPEDIEFLGALPSRLVVIRRA
jgi:hypothetical protein